MNQATGQKSFFVYRSSAGSGKTFTLVRVYLSLVFSQKDPAYYRQILAITFTNKAADEMKQRVLDYLEGFAGGESHPKFNKDMMQALRKETGLQENEIKKRSGEVLSHVLHNYSDLSISTIDRFVYRIIRSFAHELGLNPEFAIHMDVEEAVESGVDFLLEKVGIDNEVTDKLTRFVDSNVESESSFDIRKALIGFGKRAVFSEAGISSLERLKDFKPQQTEATRAALNASIYAFYAKLEEFGKSGLSHIQNLGGEIERMNSYMGNFFVKLSNQIIPALGTAKNCAEKGTVFTVPGQKNADQSILHIGEQLGELTGEILVYLESEWPKISLCERLAAELYNSATAAELRISVDETNRNENRLSIADFNKIINRVVADNPAPFIYERIGERYAHFLIDEFQDVSVLQWHNFLPLLENSLARGKENLVVGDAKQSIYRWRNGDFRQFTSIPKIPGAEGNYRLSEIEKTLERNHLPMHLDTNYRSGKVIVDFNNRLFSGLQNSENPYLRQVYKDASQQHIAHPDEGYVRIDIEDRSPESEQYKLDTLPEGWPDWMNSRIDECLEDGYALGDIAVLFYKNKDAALAAEFLSARGMAVFTSQSLLLGHSATCQLLMNTLAWFTNRTDSVAGLKAAENFWRVKKPNEDFHEMLLPFIISKPGRRQGVPDIEALFRHFGIETEKLALHYTSVYEWAENAIRLLQLQDAGDAYTEALLNQLAKLAGTGITQPAACIHWWEDEQDSLSLEATENSHAIKIMTVHKSKGLQFPVVLIPFLSGRGSGEYIWIPGEKLPHGMPAALLKTGKWMEGTSLEPEYLEQTHLAEVDEMNQFYVANTRAMNRLCIRAMKGGKASAADKFLTSGLTGIFENNSLRFELGERKSFAQKSQQSESEKEPEEPGLPSWTWRDRIQLHLRFREFVGKASNPRQEGVLLHTLFARLPREEWRTVLMEMKKTGDVSESEATTAERNMVRLAEIQEVKNWMSADVLMSEREIILPDGSVLRPDCVAETPNEIHVIDLKTGERRAAHCSQVEVYAQALKEMQSSKKIRGFLLYTSDLAVEEVGV